MALERAQQVMTNRILKCEYPNGNRGDVADEENDRYHQELLLQIETNLKEKQPLDLALREWIVLLLKTALTNLGPNLFYRIAGQVTEYLDAKGQKCKGRDIRKPFDRLNGLVDYFLLVYDGPFLGFSKYEERSMIIEYLMMHRLNKRGYCISK